MKPKTTEQLWAQLQRIENRLQKRIDDRASDPAMAKVPGGDTGLVIRREYLLKANGVEQIFFEDHVDTITLGRLNRILDKARILDEKTDAAPQNP